MSKSVLLVGTRKGCFVLESEDRRDWACAAPTARAGPSTTRAGPDSGTIFAAAASEWHGAPSGAAPTSARRGSTPSEGLGYPTATAAEAVEGLAREARARPAARRRGVGRALREHRRRQDVLARDDLEGYEGREAWNDPAQQPPGHLGLSAIIPHPSDPERFWIIVQGFSLFETTDGGKTWAPRNKGLRRDWPADYEDIGFCVHKVAPASDFERMYQQNHVGMHRSDDGGKSWTEITQGLPTEFGFAAATHPHDRDTFYVIPLDPATAGRCRTARWRLAHARRRLELAAARPRPAAARTPTSASCARDGDRRSDDRRPLLRHEHRAAVRERRRGRELEPDRRLFPGITSVDGAAVD
jgi:hypothetical protein